MPFMEQAKLLAASNMHSHSPWKLDVRALLVLAVLSVREASASIITTWIGDGTARWRGDGVSSFAPQRSVSLHSPTAMVFNSNATAAFVVDSYNNRVRVLHVGGVVSTVAGTGSDMYDGDGRVGTDCSLSYPTGLAIDAAGGIYIADSGSDRVRYLSPSGIMTTAVGDGVADFYGDGGLATAAALSAPYAVALDSLGYLLIADMLNNRVRLVVGGIITTLAGNGDPSFYGDGGPATNAALFNPSGVTWRSGSGGIAYICDSGNYVIRRVVTGTGVIDTVAGMPGVTGFGGDGGMALLGTFDSPSSVLWDATNAQLLVTDRGNNRVRAVQSNGTLTTVAGSSLVGGYTGDGGDALLATLNIPAGVAVDGVTSTIYVVDRGNNVIRWITPGARFLEVRNVVATLSAPAANVHLLITGSGMFAVSMVTLNGVNCTVTPLNVTDASARCTTASPNWQWTVSVFSSWDVTPVSVMLLPPLAAPVLPVAVTPQSVRAGDRIRLTAVGLGGTGPTSIVLYANKTGSASGGPVVAVPCSDVAVVDANAVDCSLAMVLETWVVPSRALLLNVTIRDGSTRSVSTNATASRPSLVSLSPSAQELAATGGSTFNVTLSFRLPTTLAALPVGVALAACRSGATWRGWVGGRLASCTVLPTPPAGATIATCLAPAGREAALRVSVEVCGVLNVTSDGLPPDSGVMPTINAAAYVQAPTIAAVQPALVRADAQQVVNITLVGSDFPGFWSVWTSASFGGYPCARLDLLNATVVACVDWPLGTAAVALANNASSSRVTLPLTAVISGQAVASFGGLSSASVIVQFAPRVISAVPAMTRLGDPVTIVGRFFGLASQMTVTLGGLPCTPIQATASEWLTCIAPTVVPFTTPGYPVLRVVVTVDGVPTQETVTIAVPVATPTVVAVQPALIRADAQQVVNLTLVGSGFAGAWPLWTSASFGGYPCARLDLLNATSVVCVDWPLGTAAGALANNASSSRAALPLTAVINGLLVATFGSVGAESVSVDVQLVPRVISAAPTFTRLGDPVTIVGRFFGLASQMTVTLGGLPCTPIQAAASEWLTCIAPTVAPASTPGYPSLRVVVSVDGVPSQEAVAVTIPVDLDVQWQGEVVSSGMTRTLLPGAGAGSELAPLTPPLRVIVSGSGAITCTLLVSNQGSCAGVEVPLTLTGSMAVTVDIPSNETTASITYGGIGVAGAAGCNCTVAVVCRDSSSQSAVTPSPITVHLTALSLDWSTGSNGTGDPNLPWLQTTGIPWMPTGLPPVYATFALERGGDTPAPPPGGYPWAQLLQCTGAVFASDAIVNDATSMAAQTAMGFPVVIGEVTPFLGNASNFGATVVFPGLSAQVCGFGAPCTVNAMCAWTPTGQQVWLPRVRIATPTVTLRANTSALDVQGYASTAVSGVFNHTVIDAAAGMALRSSLFAAAIDTPTLAEGAPSCRLVVVNNTSPGTVQLDDGSGVSIRADGSGFGGLFLDVTVIVTGPGPNTLYLATSCSVFGQTFSATPIKVQLRSLAITSLTTLPDLFIPSDKSSPWVPPPVQFGVVDSAGVRVSAGVVCAVAVRAASSGGVNGSDTDVQLLALTTESLSSLLPAPATGVVTSPPTVLQTRFTISAVSMQLTCRRFAGDVIAPLSWEMGVVPLRTHLCTPPPASAASQAVLRSFSVGVGISQDVCTNGSATLAAMGLTLPAITCIVSSASEETTTPSTGATATGTPTNNASATVFLQESLALVDGSSLAATFSGLSIIAAHGSLVSLQVQCAIGGVPVPPPLPFAVRIEGCAPGSEMHELFCTPCPGNTFSLFGETCLNCPTPGALCSQGLLHLQPNFYRPPSQALLPFTADTELHPCVNTEACLVNDSTLSYSCAQGYSGPLCGVCDAHAGYANFGSTLCKPCYAPAVNAFLVALVGVVTVGLMAFVSLRKASARSDAAIALRITMSFVQAVGSLRAFTAGGTRAYHDVMGWTEAVSTSPLSAPFIQCIWRAPYLLTYGLTVAAPLLVAGFVVIIFFVVAACRAATCGRAPLPMRAGAVHVLPSSAQQHLPNQHRSSLVHSYGYASFASAVREWWQSRRLAATVLFMLFLAYMPVVSKSLAALDCYSPQIDGVTYLRADMSVVCGTGPHAAAQVIAYCVLVAFGLGFPCGLFYLLRTTPNARLQEPQFRATWGFLFHGYNLGRSGSEGGGGGTSAGIRPHATSAGGMSTVPRRSLMGRASALLQQLPGHRLEPGRSLVCMCGPTIALDRTVWWEAVVLLRKAGIVLLAVLVRNPFLQCVGASVWLVAFFALQLKVQPYATPLFNSLETMSLAAACGTAIISTALLQNMDGRLTATDTTHMTSTEWAVTIVLASCNLATLCVLVSTWLWLLTKQWRGAVSRLVVWRRGPRTLAKSAAATGSRDAASDHDATQGAIVTVELSRVHSKTGGGSGATPGGPAAGIQLRVFADGSTATSLAQKPSTSFAVAALAGRPHMAVRSTRHMLNSLPLAAPPHHARRSSFAALPISLQPRALDPSPTLSTDNTDTVAETVNPLHQSNDRHRPSHVRVNALHSPIGVQARL